MGGLGCPVATILAQRGPSASPLSLTLLDDDVVDATNLHRQTLYSAADVGASKVERASVRVRELATRTGTAIEVRPVSDRITPDNARALVAGHDLVIEGADNLPTKFLTADAAALEGRPVVHAGVVRWSGWVKAVVPARGACLRCIFEDLPRDRVETCAEAGVVGALVGVMGALAGGLAIRLLGGDVSAADAITRVDALAGKARTARVRSRPSCTLCGTSPTITDVSLARYAPVCAAGA
jgi:adenylyltransferase/sulfurtransferase